MICPKCGSNVKGGYRYLTCPNCWTTFDSSQFEIKDHPVSRLEYAPEPAQASEPEPSPVSVPEPVPAPVSEPVPAPAVVPEAAPEPTTVSMSAPESAIASDPAPAPETLAVHFPRLSLWVSKIPAPVRKRALDLWTHFAVEHPASGPIIYSKGKKLWKATAILGLILLILFNLYIFAPYYLYNPAFLYDYPSLNTLINWYIPINISWFTYGFIHFAYIMLLLTPYLAKKATNTSGRSISLYAISITYFITAFVLGLVVDLVSDDLLPEIYDYLGGYAGYIFYSFVAPILPQVFFLGVFAALLKPHFKNSNESVQSAQPTSSVRFAPKDSDTAQENLSISHSQNQQQTVQLSQPTPSGRFAPKAETISKPETKPVDPAKTLLKIKKLLDAGAIDQNEYDTLKEEMMRKMMEDVRNGL